MDSGDTHTRRRFLKTGAAVGTAGVTAVAASGSASAQEYGGYLDEVGNYEGETADATGMDEIVVTVGAGSQGLLFDPAAVVVDPGTTVSFEWTGAGGAHNAHHDVDADERIFRSGDAVDTEGIEYDFTFEEEHEGAHPYVCEPHRAVEMKGVIVVGEDNVEGDTIPFGEGGAERNMAAIFGGSAVFGTVALLGVAAYREMFGEESEY